MAQDEKDVLERNNLRESIVEYLKSQRIKFKVLPLYWKDQIENARN